MRNRFMLAPLTNQQSELDGAATEFDQEWFAHIGRSGYGLVHTCATTVEGGGITIEVIEGIRRECGPSFQIGWRVSVERYGLMLEELREIVWEILDRQLIDYLDLALWDSAQIVRTGTFRGKGMLSVFTEIPRGGVRVGTAGKIMSAGRCDELLEEGCDFVLIGRAAVLERGFPLLARKNPQHESSGLPVTAQFLRDGGLSERFITHMRAWESFVQPGSI